ADVNEGEGKHQAGDEGAGAERYPGCREGGERDRPEESQHDPCLIPERARGGCPPVGRGKSWSDGKMRKSRSRSGSWQTRIFGTWRECCIPRKRDDLRCLPVFG